MCMTHTPTHNPHVVQPMLGARNATPKERQTQREMLSHHHKAAIASQHEPHRCVPSAPSMRSIKMVDLLFSMLAQACATSSRVCVFSRKPVWRLSLFVASWVRAVVCARNDWRFLFPLCLMANGGWGRGAWLGWGGGVETPSTPLPSLTHSPPSPPFEATTSTHAHTCVHVSYMFNLHSNKFTAISDGAICVQKFDDSLYSAIHITYRISLRSSSLWEPSYPSLRVVLEVIFFFLVCFVLLSTKCSRARDPLWCHSVFGCVQQQQQHTCMHVCVCVCVCPFFVVILLVSRPTHWCVLFVCV